MFKLHVLLIIVHDIAAVADCFSALKSPRKNLPIVFPINREISLFCGSSTWKLCLVVLVISPLGFREDLHGHNYVFSVLS